MDQLSRLMFPAAFKTKRHEVIEGLSHSMFAPADGEDLYSVFVYMATVTSKDGQSFMVQDVVVKSADNIDVTDDLWNKADRTLIHELTIAGYGEYRAVCSTPYYASLESRWSIGMDAKENNVLKIFPEGMKKQRCEVSSVIREFRFSLSQLMLLLKLKDCPDTIYSWAA